MYGSEAGVKHYSPKTTHTTLGFATAGELTAFLTSLLTAVSERVDAILPQGTVQSGDKNYNAVVEVVERRTAGVFPLISQMNTSPIVRIDDFAVQVVDTTGLWEGIEKELAQLFDYSVGKKRVEIFHTGGLGFG